MDWEVVVAVNKVISWIMKGAITFFLFVFHYSLQKEKNTDM